MEFALFEQLHAGRNPRYEAFDHQTPNQYARRLASYIKNPTTIRVRTIDEYGRAPSLEAIEEMQRKIAAASEMLDYGEPEPEFEKLDLPVCTLPARATPKGMITEAAKLFGLTYTDIVSRGRFAHIANARHVISLLLVDRGNSITQVGRWLNRDHSTVCNTLRKRAKIMSDPELATIYRQCSAAWARPSLSDMPKSDCIPA